MPVYDVNGNVIGFDQDYQSSNTDGAQGAKNFCIVLYNGGGPSTAANIGSGQMFDRLRSIQGKGTISGTITATVAGDTALAFPGGVPSFIMPGQSVRLSTGGAFPEIVYIAQTYVPVAGGTSIPLQQPLVTAGSTLATWDVFFTNGPLLTLMNPTGIIPVANALADNFNTGYRLMAAANIDTLSSNNTQAVAAVGYNGGNVSERMRSPNVYKPFNAQAVTISSANTPTAIWTPASGKKFRLMGYWFSTSAAAGLVFHDLAAVGGTGLLGIPSPIAAAGGILASPDIGNGVLSASINNKLWIDATAATTLTGFCWGTEE